VLHSKPKLLSLAIVATLALSACNQDTSSSAGPDFSQDKDTNTDFNQLALITNLTDNVISPTFEAFQGQAQLQTTAVSDYCGAEQAFANEAIDEQALTLAKEAAQTQWRAAMDVWQQAELMLLGPLLDQDGLLRNKIYSWPNVKTCSVDYDVVYFRSGTVNGAPYDIAKRTPSRKGMAALDYLLFNQDLRHSCDAGAPPPDWNNLSDTERKIARCRFAEEVAKDIENNATSLVQQWLASDGYANKLKQAGTAGSGFASEHEAVNRISDAMFYLDTATKDGKLAIPLGLQANSCGSSACPEAVESRFSQHSLNNIINNLIGFEKLLTGQDGIGFTDYLIDVGGESTANEMTAGVTQALSTVNAMENSMAQTLAEDPAKIEQTHTEVKAITDKLKADFITSLALELPATSAGDND